MGVRQVNLLFQRLKREHQHGRHLFVLRRITEYSAATSVLEIMCVYSIACAPRSSQMHVAHPPAVCSTGCRMLHITVQPVELVMKFFCVLLVALPAYQQLQHRQGKPH